MTEALGRWSSSHTPLILLDRILMYSFGGGSGSDNRYFSLTGSESLGKPYLLMRGHGAAPTGLMATHPSAGDCGKL